MTQPSNNEEKDKALWAFLLYLIITTGLIVLIGYFGLNVPFTENTQLKREMESYNKEKAFNTTFSALMNNTRSMIIDSSKKDTSFADLQLTDSLKKINMIVANDSIHSKSIYLNAITALNILQQSNQQLRATVGIDEKIKDLKDQIDKKGAELENINEISKLTEPK